MIHVEPRQKFVINQMEPVYAKKDMAGLDATNASVDIMDIRIVDRVIAVQ